jgi:hypothetical protein
MDSFSLNVFGTSKGDGPVVAGSLDAVTASAQKVMREDLHLFVTAHRNSDTATLTSTTPGGKRFTLVLKARKTEHGEETQASIQWEKDADDAFWVQLAAAIARPHADEPPTHEHAWIDRPPPIQEGPPTP